MLTTTERVMSAFHFNSVRTTLKERLDEAEKLTGHCDRDIAVAKAREKYLEELNKLPKETLVRVLAEEDMPLSHQLVNYVVTILASLQYFDIEELDAIAKYSIIDGVTKMLT